MRKIFSIVLVLNAFAGFTQNQIVFPDTLTGTVFNLQMHNDSVQFLAGRKTLTNAFNQYSYLGPTLIMNKGEQVTMHVTNQLDDTTTVHWHGLHVPAHDDGGPHTVILSGATWSPDFEVKNNASTYWYHPHTHMKTGMQAMRGAAGLIIVRDAYEAALNLPRAYGKDDFPLVVQSQQFDNNNQIVWRGMHDSILLVNGTIHPEMQTPAQVVRFRLLNASQERNFNFGFTENSHFYVIGNDGGLLQQPVSVTRIRLSPGERAEILLNLTGQNGHTLFLMSYASEFGAGVQGGTPMMGMDTAMYSPLNGIDFNILKIQVVEPLLHPVTAIPSHLVTITPWQPSQANTTRNIHITTDNMMSMDGPFYFNGELFDMERIDQMIPLNNIEIWTIFNQTMVAHPFHIHDVQFFVLDRDGITASPEEKGFKDVVMVAPNETVRFITKFEDFADTTIPYMYHCHILMHEDDGMMGQFIVYDNTTSVSELKHVSDGIEVYPNPVNGDQITVSILPEFAARAKRIKLSDAGGKVVKNVTAISSNFVKIDIKDIAPGVYFLSVDFENATAVHRVVKN